jgi:glutathione synthase
MRALFVMDPLSSVHVDQDSSYALMLEWQAREGEVWHCGPRDLWSEGDEVFALASRLSVGPRPKVADVLERSKLALSSCSTVFKRTDPPFDMNYIFCTYLLDLAAAANTVVCNEPAGLRDANEKMIILRFPDLIPETLVTRDMAQIRSFIEEQGGRAVVKPWDGNGGRGIFVLESADKNLGAMIEMSTADGRDYVMVQAYIPDIINGDKRILLIDGEPKGAFLRVPPKNDHRGNMHVGAVVKACEMTERDLHICQRLAPYLKEHGLVFTGIDVIGGLLTEVNVTSPTGIQECARLYGSDIAADIVDAVLARGAPS